MNDVSTYIDTAVRFWHQIESVAIVCAVMALLWQVQRFGRRMRDWMAEIKVKVGADDPRASARTVEANWRTLVSQLQDVANYQRKQATYAKFAGDPTAIIWQLRSDGILDATQYGVLWSCHSMQLGASVFRTVYEPQRVMWEGTYKHGFQILSGILAGSYQEPD